MDDVRPPRPGPGRPPFSRTIALCASCPKLCRHECPVAEVEQRETVTPWGLMTAAFMQDRGPSRPGQGRDPWPYHCTGCAACRTACKFHNDVPGAVQALRQERFAAGVAPERAVSARDRYLRHGGNMYAPGVLLRIRDLVAPERIRPRPRTLIIADPTTVVRYPDVVRAAERLLDAIEMQDAAFFVSEEVSGAGQVLYDVGDDASFARYARRFRHAVGNPDRIYTLRPSDAHLLRDIYPRFGVPWTIPTSSFLERLLECRHRLPRAPVPAGGMVVHEACHLTRFLDGADLAATLLETVTGVRPRTPARSGDATVCCGGGGGLPLILPEVADRVSRLSMTRLAPGEQETVVTTCSTCHRRFEKVATTPIQDILVLLAGSP